MLNVYYQTENCDSQQNHIFKTISKLYKSMRLQDQSHLRLKSISAQNSTSENDINQFVEQSRRTLPLHEV